MVPGAAPALAKAEVGGFEVFLRIGTSSQAVQCPPLMKIKDGGFQHDENHENYLVDHLVGAFRYEFLGGLHLTL